MLKGLDPLLSPDLLYLLARMGHGDDIALVDANHPAEAIAASTVSGTLVRLPGIRVDDLLRAVLMVFPLDGFTDDPVRFMQQVDRADEIPEAVTAMQKVVTGYGFKGRFASLERFEFYATARKSFGIVQCGEQRLYGNVLLRKGVI
jgi:L-fucose mutarotase